MEVSKKSIFIAHRRETSNALNASVRGEQKRLQRLSETVPANNRISQVVRHGIAGRWTSHTESLSAIKVVTQERIRMLNFAQFSQERICTRFRLTGS